MSKAFRLVAEETPGSEIVDVFVKTKQDGENVQILLNGVHAFSFVRAPGGFVLGRKAGMAKALEALGVITGAQGAIIDGDYI